MQLLSGIPNVSSFKFSTDAFFYVYILGQLHLPADTWQPYADIW